MTASGNIPDHFSRRRPFRGSMGVVDDSPIEIADIHHIYSHHRALKSTVVLPCWLRTPETPEVAQNDANEECRVPSGDKRRRKKRRERYPDAIRQQRCREADDRHAAFVPLISRYQNDAGLRQQVSALASSRRCEVDTAPPRSDWILLGSMSSVVQPTCVLEHSCAAVPPGDRSCASPSHEGAVEGPLYGHDVRNESDVDVVLRAGPDARVIMPPR